MKGLRILHLLASPVFSGPAELVAQLASEQRAQGHQVSVAIDRKREGLGSEEPAAPRLRELNLLDEGGLELSVKSSPAAVLRDVRTLRQRAVDVVHAHFSHDHLLARFGRPRGVTLVRSIHAPRSVRWSLPAADGYTVPYEELGSQLRHGPWITLPALVGAEFSPPADVAALRRELGLSGGPIVGMGSTFQRSRRHEVALAAFAQLRSSFPDARLVLLGDGVLEPSLRSQVQALGLEDRVVFAGYQSGAAFVRWMQTFDELWVLGLGNDYSARVAAQGRACGARVVAVAEGALGKYADAIVPKADPVLLAAVALASERVQVKRESPAEVAARVVELYQRLRAGGAA